MEDNIPEYYGAEGWDDGEYSYKWFQASESLITSAVSYNQAL
jgi:hypothetical protein